MRASTRVTDVRNEKNNWLLSAKQWQEKPYGCMTATSYHQCQLASLCGPGRWWTQQICCRGACWEASLHAYPALECYNSKGILVEQEKIFKKPAVEQYIHSRLFVNPTVIIFEFRNNHFLKPDLLSHFCNKNNSIFHFSNGYFPYLNALMDNYSLISNH